MHWWKWRICCWCSNWNAQFLFLNGRSWDTTLWRNSVFKIPNPETKLRCTHRIWFSWNVCPHAFKFASNCTSQSQLSPLSSSFHSHAAERRREIEVVDRYKSFLASLYVSTMIPRCTGREMISNPRLNPIKTELHGSKHENNHWRLCRKLFYWLCARSISWFARTFPEFVYLGLLAFPRIHSLPFLDICLFRKSFLLKPEQERRITGHSTHLLLLSVKKIYLEIPERIWELSCSKQGFCHWIGPLSGTRNSSNGFQSWISGFGITAASLKSQQKQRNL
jgi:hypothetical protein